MHLVKSKAFVHDLKSEVKELRGVLQSAEGYRGLEQTVVELSAIMVSKRAETLTPA